MGFSTAAASVANQAMNNATGLFSDFAAPLALVFGVAVLGLLFAVVRRFMQ